MKRLGCCGILADMNPKLTQEQLDALHANEGDVRVTDPTTQRVYVLVDDDTHRRAMDALRRQEDLKAVRAGIDDIEAGRVLPAAEAHARVREQLIAKHGQ